jgi:truncated hemoglobin YjbI
VLRAVLKDGKIQPLDPLPPDWSEGEELVVERLTDRELTPEEVDEWARKMDEICADIAPEVEAQLQSAIDEHRQEAKAWMRRRMGLPD